MKKEKTQKIDGKSIAINTQHFTGIANFAKSDLQIPVNIWIDNNDTYEKGGDWKRVKIQLNTSSNTLNDCQIMRYLIFTLSKRRNANEKKNPDKKF